MPFQKFEVHKNYDLMFCRKRPKNSGFESDITEKKSKKKYFPKMYYKYNDKFYVQDRSILEYNHSIVYKRLICIDDEFDQVIFYDKKTFDTEVERIRAYGRPSKSVTCDNKTSKRVMVVHKEKNNTRVISDSDIDKVFELATI